MFGAPPPPPASASLPSDAFGSTSGLGQIPSTTAELGSPPSEMFGAPPPGSFGAPPPVDGGLGSPLSSTLGAPSEGPRPAADELGSPPPSMFGAAPPGAFGAPPPAAAGGPPPASASRPTGGFGASPPDSGFGAASPPSSSGAGAGAPPRNPFAARQPPPSRSAGDGNPVAAGSEPGSGSEVAEMFGAPPPGAFGAPFTTPADAGSTSSATFGAPPQELFGAPPSGRSAGSGSTPVAAAKAEAPPASMFDAPPPPQAPSGALSAPPPMLGGGGSPPSRPDGSSRDTTGVREQSNFKDEGASAADLFGSTPGEDGPFGGAAGSRTDPFGVARDSTGARDRSGGTGEFAAPDAGATTGAWPGKRREEEPGGGATMFGSPPGEAFGEGGAEEEQASPWWENVTDEANRPGEKADPSNAAGGNATTTEQGGGGDAPGGDLRGVFGGPADEQRMETPLSAVPGGAEKEDLGAPPADMFGPPAVAHVADTEMEARKQGAPPLGPPPRPQALSKGPPRSGISASPAPFSPRSPHGVKVDGEATEGASSSGEVGNDGSRARAELWPSGGDARTDRTASPGWEKQPSPPLELGVFGAPPDDSCAPTKSTADLFGAADGGGATDESHGGKDDHGGWGMSPADPEEASEPGAMTNAAGGHAVLSASAAPARREPPRGKAGVPGHPRSSFVATGVQSSATVAALGLGAPPASPPRLFASRSSSWAERNSEPPEEKSGYGGMFASSPEGSPSTATGAGPSSSLAMEEVVSLLPNVEPSQASAFPDVGSAGGESAKFSHGHQPKFSTIPEAADTRSPPRLRGAPEERSEEGSAAGVVSSNAHARGGVNEAVAATPEGGSRAGPGSTLSTPFGAWSRESGMTPEIAEGFPPSEDGGAFDSGRPPSVDEDSSPDTAKSPGLSQPSEPGAPASAVVPSAFGDDSGAALASTAAAAEETSNGGPAETTVSNPEAVEGKEDEQPRWPTPQAEAGPPTPPASGEAAQKVDGDGAVDDVDGWSEDDWGVDEDADDGGAGDGAGGEGRGREGDVHLNDISIAETTASDFFATPTSPESDVGSPRPRARREGRASMSSLSPLSGYNSAGSRRKRRETSDGSGSIFSSSSPYTAADVPPIFPLSAAPRARRSSSAAAAAAASSGGLPPPVPVAHTYGSSAGPIASSERSTWRSLSPSRAGDDRGWSLSPVLAARAGTHRSISPVLLGKAGPDGLGVAYVSPSARTGGRTTGSAGVARLGLAMGMPSEASSDLGGELGTRTKASGVAGGGMTVPPQPPAGEAAAPAVSFGGDAERLPPDVGTPSNEPSSEAALPNAPLEEEAGQAQSSGSANETSAGAEAPEGSRPPPTSSDADQGWVTGLSAAAPPMAPPDADEQGRPSVGDLPDTSETDDAVRGDDGGSLGTAAPFTSDGKSPPGGPQSPPPKPPPAPRTSSFPRGARRPMPPPQTERVLAARRMRACFRRVRRR
ncbi:unnamed protein product [Scytosiphon promiscuus]